MDVTYASERTVSNAYTVTDSNDPNGPAYDFIDITQTGNELPLGDDEWVSAMFGFSFPVYDQTHDFGFVSSNGFIDFSNQIGGLGFSNQCPLANNSMSYPNELIAIMWDDLEIEASLSNHLTNALILFNWASVGNSLAQFYITTGS